VFRFGLMFAGGAVRQNASDCVRRSISALCRGRGRAGCGGGSNSSGGGGQPGTTTGTYHVTINATTGQSGQAGFATQVVTVTLTVQ